MKITRQTESGIVVEDGSAAIPVVVGIVFLFLFVLGLTLRWYLISCVSAAFLVNALLSLRRSTFVFNPAAQTIHWSRLHIARKETGSLAFSDVQDIVIETRNPGDPALLCRLSLRTAPAAIPISIGYSVRQDHAATVRRALLDFMKSSAAPKPASAATPVNTDDVRTQQLNDSIRSLLGQGRKIDAILLVQQSDHLDLTEATFRVNHVANQMRTKQPAAKA